MLNEKEQSLIDAASEVVLAGRKPTPRLLKGAVRHCRWLLALGESERAASWHVFYTRAFAKVGLSMPSIGADCRAVTSSGNGKRGGRPSGRPSYCVHPECKGCRSCPLVASLRDSQGKAFYKDCQGRKLGRTWAMEV